MKNEIDSTYFVRVKDRGLVEIDKPCVTKGWKFMTFTESEFRIWLSFRGLTNSRNWSMGSLNIDLFSVSLHLGKREFYMVYRLNVTPPPPLTYSVKGSL